MTTDPYITTPSQILETLALSAARPTTAPPRPDSNESLKKKSDWLSKWLPLRITHPQIQVLCDKIYQFATEYAKKPKRGRTLVLFGENGCGKTMSAKSVARWASSVAIKLPMVEAEIGVRLALCEYAHWPSVVDGFHKQDFGRTEELRDCELMILDDVGAEHDPSGFGREQLYLLLTRREFKWNILTTNLPPVSWEDRLERRIASRLFRNATHIDLSKVPDYSTL